MKRREFIQNSLLVAGGLALAPFVEAADKKRIGLQLYTVRDIIKQDPKGVLKKISEFGYTDVETYDYNAGMIFGMTYKALGDYIKSLGMQVQSGHYNIKIARDLSQWQKAIDDAKAVGQKYMVVPFIEKEERTIDSYKKIIETLNKAGELCRKSGIRFLYHNHEFEFQTVDGQVPYDLMLKGLEPKLVGMELDLYWVHNAGLDPLDLFAKNPGRYELWHVKDMDKADKSKQADLGTGKIDFKRIFAKAKQAGMKAFFIEQENYPVGSLESAKVCIDNFKKMM
jgi:sugar phosphate isomerase/epimerase